MNPISNSNQAFAHDAVNYTYQPYMQVVDPQQPPATPFKINTAPAKSEKAKKDMKKAKGSKQGGTQTPFGLMSGE
jgi:hypothetical protein